MTIMQKNIISNFARRARKAPADWRILFTEIPKHTTTITPPQYSNIKRLIVSCILGSKKLPQLSNICTKCALNINKFKIYVDIREFFLCFVFLAEKLLPETKVTRKRVSKNG